MKLIALTRISHQVREKLHNQLGGLFVLLFGTDEYLHVQRKDIDMVFNMVKRGKYALFKDENDKKHFYEVLREYAPKFAQKMCITLGLEHVDLFSIRAYYRMKTVVDYFILRDWLQNFLDNQKISTEKGVKLLTFYESYVATERETKKKITSKQKKIATTIQELLWQDAANIILTEYTDIEFDYILDFMRKTGYYLREEVVDHPMAVVNCPFKFECACLVQANALLIWTCIAALPEKTDVYILPETATTSIILTRHQSMFTIVGTYVPFFLAFDPLRLINQMWYFFFCSWFKKAHSRIAEMFMLRLFLQAPLKTLYAACPQTNLLLSVLSILGISQMWKSLIEHLKMSVFIDSNLIVLRCYQDNGILTPSILTLLYCFYFRQKQYYITPGAFQILLQIEMNVEDDWIDCFKNPSIGPNGMYIITNDAFDAILGLCIQTGIISNRLARLILLGIGPFDRNSTIEIPRSSRYLDTIEIIHTNKSFPCEHPIFLDSQTQAFLFLLQALENVLFFLKVLPNPAEFLAFLQPDIPLLFFDNYSYIYENGKLPDPNLYGYWCFDTMKKEKRWERLSYETELTKKYFPFFGTCDSFQNLSNLDCMALTASVLFPVTEIKEIEPEKHDQRLY